MLMCLATAQYRLYIRIAFSLITETRVEHIFRVIGEDVNAVQFKRRQHLLDSSLVHSRKSISEIIYVYRNVIDGFESISITLMTAWSVRALPPFRSCIGQSQIASECLFFRRRACVNHVRFSTKHSIFHHVFFTRSCTNREPGQITDFCPAPGESSIDINISMPDSAAQREYCKRCAF